MKSFRNIRVIPVVLVAIGALAAFKIAGLVFDGGYVFDYRGAQVRAQGKPSWAQAVLNFPGGPKLAQNEFTGSVPEKPKEAAKEDAPKSAVAETKPDGVVIHPEDRESTISPSELAVLERLQARRQELEARAREIEIRESLLKAAEKRIESKVQDLRALETRAAAEKEQKSEAENARLKGLVTTYESMKPKDAARVFDRLEMSVLIEIASQIAPRKMSDIMGQMVPEAAERLTVELARRGAGDKSASSAAELPKIEGKILPQRAN